MLLRDNHLVFVEDDNLYFKHISASSNTLVSSIEGTYILDGVFGKSQYVFLTEDYTFFSYWFSTSEQEVYSDCLSSYEAVPEQETNILTPLYVNSNFSENEWWNNLKPYVIDYSYFSNSFNFLTSFIDDWDIFVNRKNIYKKGEILPDDIEAAGTQYWITMPIGTATCSSIQYNIIPLKTNEIMGGFEGLKEYTKFNIDHDSISLIFSVSSYPIQIKEDTDFKWPDFFAETNLSSIEFVDLTNGTFSGNSDWIVNKTTGQSAWFLDYSTSSVWIDPETNLESDMFISTSDVLNYIKFDNASSSALADILIEEGLLGYLVVNHPNEYSYLQV